MKIILFLVVGLLLYWLGTALWKAFAGKEPETKKFCVDCKWSQQMADGPSRTRIMCASPHVGTLSKITGEITPKSCVIARDDDGLWKFFQTNCGPYGKHYEKRKEEKAK